MSQGAAWLTGLIAAFLVLANIVICVLALGVLPGNRKPSTAMAWLILILAVPFLGMVAFLLFGSTSVGRKRRAWQSEVNARVLEAVEAQHSDGAPPDGVRHDVDDLSRLNQRLGALPMSAGNTVELLPDYQGSVAAMCAEIAAAQHFVHVQFYISSWDDTTSDFFE